MMKNSFCLLYLLLQVYACNFSPKNENLSTKESKNDVNSKMIDSLSIEYQKCLDTGIGMYGCTEVFYRKMDSLLHLVHYRIIEKANPKDLDSLKNDQKVWLILKKNAFLYIEIEYRKDRAELGDGDDLKMIVLDKKAKILKKRLMQISKKRETVN